MFPKPQCVRVKLILTYAGVGAVHLAAGVGLVAGGTLVTLWSHRVVQTVVTHASAPPAAGLVHGLVKVAALGMIVALASCGGCTETVILFLMLFNVTLDARPGGGQTF